jgi:lambda family phage portal protein
MPATWLDRAIGFLSPQVGLRRLRAQTAHALLQRHYEGAATGRRTQGWYRVATDANTAIGPSLAKLRDAARDLVRNNPYAESALSTIVDHAVGWGIVASEKHDAWTRWANSTACDADGRNDLAGLEKLVMRTVVESGECLVRRRWRRLEDGLPLPIQLQILEPDFLDTSKETALLPNGGKVVQGVEFDPLGKRVAYWLYRSHPGSAFSLTSSTFSGASSRIPAEDLLHNFKPGRPGQVRGPSWFAPVLLRFKDFDEFEDATLMKQKIAACLAVITSDVDGSAPALGTADDSATPGVDSLEPGMIMNVAPGRDIHVVQPPNVQDYVPYSKTMLRAIATGLGVTYEDLTGDYENLPFSAARMSRLRHWARVEDWRWRLLVPQFLNPVWAWAMQASEIMGLPTVAMTEWTAPPLPMIEPDKEGLAIQRNIRTGITTLSEEIRARGYNRNQFLDELQADFKDLDDRGLVLDCDPRKMTQAGMFQSAAPQGAGTRDLPRGFVDLLTSVEPNVAVDWLKKMFGPTVDGDPT